jgi:dihydroxy-acid dehydratase
MPLAPEGGTVILTGNLCLDGAVLKQSAASHLLTHRGRAVVFEDHADPHRRIDDPALALDETSVLVLKHVGPKGAPGMPEWGAALIPARLLKKGVKDMVRIELDVPRRSLTLRVSDEELARRRAASARGHSSTARGPSHS